MTAPWAVIAKRELLERLRSPWFIVTTLLGPLLLFAAMLIPVLIASAGAGQGARVVIVDDGSGVGQTLAAELFGRGWQVDAATVGANDEALLAEIAAERIDGFIHLPQDLVAGRGRALYRGDNASNQAAMASLAGALADAVAAVRLRRHGLDGPTVKAALARPALATRHTTGDGEGGSGAATFALAYALVILLYMAILIYGVNVMRAVVVEKTHKVVEVLLASIRAEALMLGKISGVGLAGLMQVAFWALALVVLTDLGLGDAGGLIMPTIEAGDVAVILAYFVLGYFFYASVYAAIGAMVSSEQEAQQAQVPVVIILIIPIVCMQLVANDPRGDAAEILSQIPFTSPFLMPMRYLLDGAGVEAVTVSLGILGLSTWLMTKIAGRIFRVGILMTGKRPRLRELWQWIRHP